MICSVDLLKGTTAALQHVGGILQTASSVKLEMSALEVFGVLQSVTHVYANFWTDSRVGLLGQYCDDLSTMKHN